MIKQAWVLITCVCLTVVASSTSAIEQHTAAGELSHLLDVTQTVLVALEQPIRDVAETDQFGLVWAGAEGATHITIAVRVLPVDDPRAQITVASDSPTDARLEQQILEQIIATANTEN